MKTLIKPFKDFYLESLQKVEEAKKEMDKYEMEMGVPEKEGVNKYPVEFKEMDGDKKYKGVYDSDEEEIAYEGDEPEKKLNNQFKKMAAEELNADT